MPIQQYSTGDISVAIRLGFAWRIEFSQSITNGTTLACGLTTGPRGAIVSDRSFAAANTTAVFGFYRNTTFTGGAALTPRNRNDRFWNDATRAALTAAASGVTATPNAADLMASLTIISPAGPTAQFVGSEATEIVLAPNTSYVLTIQNAGASPAVCGFSAILIQDHLSDGSLR